MRWQGSLRIGASPAVLAFVLAFTPVAAAELPRAGLQFGENVAASPAGHLAAVSDDRRLPFRFAEPGAGFGPAEPVGAERGGFEPVIALGPSGEALAVWVTGGQRSRLLAAYRPADGRFEPATVLSEDPPPGEQTATVEFDARGVGTVLWAASTGAGHLRVRDRSTAGVWSAEETIPAPGAFRPQLVVASSGAATAAWRQDAPGLNRTRVAAAARAPDGRFGSPQVVAGAQREPSEAVLASNDRGDAVVAWVQSTDTRRGVDFSVHGAFRAGGGRFGSPTRLSRLRREGAEPSVSVGETGRMILAWTDNAARTVEARVRTRSGALLAPRLLSRDLEVNTGVAALASKDGVVGWYDRDPGKSFFRLAAASGAGSFGQPRTVFTTREFVDGPRIFAVPDGLALIGPGERIVRSG